MKTYQKCISVEWTHKLYSGFYVHPFVYFRITNLKYWGTSEQIITKTLQLLSDLSVGYSSVRKLVKLEAVQFMLNNHTVSESRLYRESADHT